MEYEIQRFCWFDTVGYKGSARETLWKYKRAIAGHKLVLVDVEINVKNIEVNEYCTFQTYNGHTYSHWGSFPGIYDQSTLSIFTANEIVSHNVRGLNNWECKEFTMSARNSDTNYAIQFCMIVYFYEIPMSKLETLEYAVKQPRYKYRHGGPRTLGRFED